MKELGRLSSQLGVKCRVPATMMSPNDSGKAANLLQLMYTLPLAWLRVPQDLKPLGTDVCTVPNDSNGLKHAVVVKAEP